MSSGGSQPSVGGPLASTAEAWKSYEVLLRAAETIARILGSPVPGLEWSDCAPLVGRVSSAEEVSEPVPILVPHEVWVRVLSNVPELLVPGSYLLAVDPKTLNTVLLEVVEARLQPLTAELRGMQLYVDVGGDMSHGRANLTPIRLMARPIAAKHVPLPAEVIAGKAPQEACRLNGIREEVLSLFRRATAESPGLPPDPGSPVVVPQPESLQEMLLSLDSRDSLILGALGALDRPYRGPGGDLVPLPLPWEVLKKHVLITGTTGSGKTSLVKNLLINALVKAELEPEKWKGLRILVLDAAGDYVAAVAPGRVRGDTYGISKLYSPCSPEGTRVEALLVIPHLNLRQSDGRTTSRNPASVCLSMKDYAEHVVGEVAFRVTGVRCRIVDTECCPQPGYPAHMTVEANCGGKAMRFAVAAVAVKADPRRPLSSLLADDPFLTARAREALVALDSYITTSSTSCRGLNVYDLVEAARKAAGTDNCSSLQGCARELCDKLRSIAAKSTIGNIARRLEVLAQSGIYADNAEPVLPIDYGTLEGLAEKLGLKVIIADLDYAATRMTTGASPERVKVTLGYRLLKSLAANRSRGGEGRVLVVIDEARLFFPQEAPFEEEKEAYNILSTEITRLARLGRSRGVGIIFSTHRPDDVSRVIVTLANTKIYFRTDRASAERLVIPKNLRERLTGFRDHAAVVESYYLRGGYATFIGAPALPGHRTG